MGYEGTGAGTYFTAYSVFECVLSVKKYQELKNRLQKVFNPQQDNLRFYPISQHTLNQVETWGVASPPTEPFQSIII
jgi:CRISPR-associated protein Cas2